MKPSTEQMNKAIALLHCVDSVLNVEKASKKRYKQTLFITKDLMQNLIDTIAYIPNVKSEIITIGNPVEKIKFKVGEGGMIGNVEFRIIDGRNECFSGIEIFAEALKVTTND
jgi:hypothetical protein